MRTLILITLVGLISNICYSQDVQVAEKRNVYNEKGDYYFDINEFGKAIFFYNMAYEKDTTDYFSVLKKAEAYSKMKLYPQAEECYRIIFERNKQVDNVYRLKYALTLLDNNKQEELKHWMSEYSKVVDNEIKSKNYLVSSEKRMIFYKDSSIVLVTKDGKIDTINFKVKITGIKMRRKPSPMDSRVNLIVSNGDEYFIGDKDNSFEFGFLPNQNYKLIIRKENIKVEDMISDGELNTRLMKRKFLSPPPLEQAEIVLQQGMKFLFSSGKSIPPEYINALKSKTDNYQQSGANVIDLTALVKEMQFSKGDVYTMRFVKDASKKSEISTLFLDDQEINVYDQSFFMVLPFSTETNFNVKTDLKELDKFNPKKYAVHIDDSPILLKDEQTDSKMLVSLLVNTKSIEEVKRLNQITGKEISIIPGTEYILTLSKPDPVTGKKTEVFVPVSFGVKYVFTSNEESKSKYKKALDDFIIAQKNVVLAVEEVINISVLSKELEILPGEDLTFNLLPVKKIGKQATVSEELKSKLTVDEKKYFITRDDKFSINVPIDINRKMNFQTDLNYIKENFNANAFTLSVDTTSFASDLIDYPERISRDEDVITDPVFDLISIYFAVNEHSLSPESGNTINEKVINELKGDSRLYVTIKGFTDGLGNADYNLKLSERRAESVKEFLINSGIKESKIRTFSFGASQSLDEGVNWEDLSEAELSKHRKVEIVIYLPE